MKEVETVEKYRQGEADKWVKKNQDICFQVCFKKAIDVEIHGNKIAVEEADRRMQKMGLYESRQIRKGGPAQQEAPAVVGSLER